MSFPPATAPLVASVLQDDDEHRLDMAGAVLLVELAGAQADRRVTCSCPHGDVCALVPEARPCRHMRAVNDLVASLAGSVVSLTTYRANASCPKCNEARVAVGYVPVGGGGCSGICSKLRCDALGAGRVNCGFATCKGTCREEHLHRTCQRCGFAWPEAVLSPGPA